MNRYSVGLRAILILVFLLSPLAPSQAHTTRGHNVLEAAAYKSLLKKKTGDIPQFPEYSGKEILDYLIAQRILRVPPCYPFDGRENHSCAVYVGEDSLPWLPVTGSGDMDGIMYRQFSTNGQNFHFMAAPSDIYHDPEIDERTGAPRGLSDQAYPRVLRSMTAMFYELLVNRDRARDQYRDIYALIHTVGDSYSEAHTQRDSATWEIGYLKPWQATAWQPYLVHWSGWKHFFSDNHHAFPTDSRDKQYFKEEFVKPEEIDYYDRNPYFVPRYFLNERGLRGADAIEDLLVTTFAVVKHEEGHTEAGLSEYANEAWKDFLNRHFRSSTDTVTIKNLRLDIAPRQEQEWRPLTMIGIRPRTRSVPDSKDVMLTINFGKAPSALDPFAFAGGAEVGSRFLPDRTLFVGSVSFSLYLWLYSDILSWGFDPSVVEVSSDGKELLVDPMASFLRFDAYIARRVWLSIEGLRYSFKSGFRSKEISLTIGVTFSKEILTKEALYHLMGGTDWFPRASSLGGERWTIPDLDSPLRLRSKNFGIFHPFGYSFFSGGERHIAMHPIGYSYIFDLSKTSKTSDFGVGFYLGAGFDFFEEKVWGFLRASSLVRLKLSSVLSAVVEPISVMPRIPFSKEAITTVEPHSTLGIAFVLGSIEVHFDLLRYSYRLKQLDQGYLGGFRFGVLRE